MHSFGVAYRPKVQVVYIYIRVKRKVKGGIEEDLGSI
jgi:hypothetical protein